MLNTYPKWKYILLLIVLALGIVYALPNLFGEEYVVQITPISTESSLKDLEPTIIKLLVSSNISYKKIQHKNNMLVFSFFDVASQLKAHDIIGHGALKQFNTALNLSALTPAWLQNINAEPMKLGLDLRGGIHFLMDVDLNSIIERKFQGYYSDLRKELMSKKIRYTELKRVPIEEAIYISFENQANLEEAYKHFKNVFQELDLFQIKGISDYRLRAKLNARALYDVQTGTVEQTVSTLRNRINELGVAEALVQRQGTNRIIVELPGVQDTARAKNILGKTATLQFLMEDDNPANNEKANNKQSVPGSKIYDYNGRTVLLKKQIILTGNAISGATTSFDGNNRPAVSIRLNASSQETKNFTNTTTKNVGKRMAVLYIETKTTEKLVNDEVVYEHKNIEKLISLAVIQSALGNQFQITGLAQAEAKDLALLLRAGALPATVTIVEERIIGPSMGQENIRMGILSAGVGLGLVLLFMTAYYGIFGVIANIALAVNLILLLAIMSLIGATLTLPGIAGIVLTLGMAVDANVLIFERIREELRAGTTPQVSIHRGFECAFGTILDSNLTTLIAGVILFAVGTGPIKGFAVTLSIGILTSLFTAITGSRAMINFIYGNRNIKKIPIGI